MEIKIFLLYIICFLLGLFITLSLFNFTKFFVKETFVGEKENNKIDVKTNLNINKTDEGIKLSDSFISITSYTNKIDNNILKWYDENTDLKEINMGDFNNLKYFNISSYIDYFNNEGLIKGANINNNELKGPIALSFSNEYDNTEINKKDYSLTSFTVIFMIKFNNIENESILFELLGNTNQNYIPIGIFIKFLINKNKNIDIQLTIGNDVYDIKNIDKKILLGIDITFISLTFDNKNILLKLNNIDYSFEYKQKDIKITLGSSPFIINKNGDIDAILYSFMYYKKALSDNEISSLKKYNNFYIFGLYNKEIDNENMKKSLINMKNNMDLKDAMIKELNDKLLKCSTNNINTSNINIQDNLLPIEQIPVYKVN